MPVGGSITTPRSGMSPRDTRLGWLFVTAQFVLLGVLAVSVAGTSGGPIQWAAGAFAIGTGVAVMVVASQRLGRELRTHPAPSAAAVLRVDGPYRVVRHPIYAGLLLVAAGMAVVGGTLLAAAAVVALLALLSLKARFEERLLAERFPGYREYALRTPRFVPAFPRFPRRG